MRLKIISKRINRNLNNKINKLLIFNNKFISYNHIFNKKISFNDLKLNLNHDLLLLLNEVGDLNRNIMNFVFNFENYVVNYRTYTFNNSFDMIIILLNYIQSVGNEICNKSKPFWILLNNELLKIFNEVIKYKNMNCHNYYFIDGDLEFNKMTIGSGGYCITNYLENYENRI